MDIWEQVAILLQITTKCHVGGSPTQVKELQGYQMNTIFPFSRTTSNHWVVRWPRRTALRDHELTRNTLLAQTSYACLL